MPELLSTDTVLLSLEDQTSPEVKLFWLPSLKVPVADICQVSAMFRVKPCGPTATPVSVGLTKNPWQLMASASVPRTASAPINRTLDFIEDIFWNSLGARLGGLIVCCSKIVAERNLAQSKLRYLNL
jgi:hypothetical protein